MNKKYLFLFGALTLLFIGVGFLSYHFLFGAPDITARAEQLTIPLGTSESDIIQKLYDQGFIRSKLGFQLVLDVKHENGMIQPGGYEIPAGTSAWGAADTLKVGPALVWVVVPEGLRKEEIGALLAKALLWTDTQKTEWTNVDTVTPADYFEGVYFPDTYLMPASTTPADAAKRMQDQFQSSFASDAKAAVAQNIKWTTLLKIASLVQREAAGPTDMPLVAGIIWNRLLQNMRLQLDSTVQYARGDTATGWWAPVSAADIKNIDSPYNTYEHNGLPPTPIDNPGLDAIHAALYPASTTCLYYLHDANGQIHCADTFAEHQANIAKYLQ